MYIYIKYTYRRVLGNSLALASNRKTILLIDNEKLLNVAHR